MIEKDVNELVEIHKVSLKYRCCDYSDCSSEIHLFAFNKKYCVFQKGVLDKEYDDAKEAIKEFNNLIEKWEKK